MATNKTWLITCAAGGHALRELTQQIAATGFSVRQVLTEIGCITGEASDAVAAQVRALPGVADVSPDFPIDIGPPDAEITL